MPLFAFFPAFFRSPIILASFLVLQVPTPMPKASRSRGMRVSIIYSLSWLLSIKGGHKEIYGGSSAIHGFKEALDSILCIKCILYL